MTGNNKQLSNSSYAGNSNHPQVVSTKNITNLYLKAMETTVMIRINLPLP